MNELYQITERVMWLLSYVLAFMLMRRSDTNRRKIALILTLTYLAGGVFALYLLPHIAGAHYDYWDVAFAKDGKLEFAPMDFRFVTNHLGLAVCVGSVLANYLFEDYKIMWVPAIGFLMPAIGEVTFRFSKWQSVFEILFGNDTRKTQSSIASEIVAGIGPSIIAGVFLLLSLAILSRLIKDGFANSKNA